MRLIDADALPTEIVYSLSGGGTRVVRRDVIDAAPTVCRGECDKWDGPMANGWGKCCVWTINSSPANPGCGMTHFRDTPEAGHCHRFKRRDHD